MSCDALLGATSAIPFEFDAVAPARDRFLAKGLHVVSIGSTLSVASLGATRTSRGQQMNRYEIQLAELVRLSESHDSTGRPKDRRAPSEKKTTHS